MSVIFTESFMRYQRRAPDSTELNADLEAGGLALRSYNSANSYPPSPPIAQNLRWEVIADPVYAARNAVRSLQVSAVSSTRATVIPFPFAAATDHYIFGCRMRLEPSAASLTNVTALKFTVGPASLSKNTSGTTNNPTFALPQDLWAALLSFDLISNTVSSGVTGTMVDTSYTYTQGADVFIEVEVDTVANLVRAWVDDLLILDSAFGAGVLAAAKAEYDLGVAVMASEASGAVNTVVQATVRDMYCVAVDAVTPFQRLGPTTQVIGEVPTDDAAVQFTRPAGYASNAAVAALPVIPDPADYLTADQVGQTDLYGVAGSEVATAAAQVYAVGVKTQVANFAAAAHTIGAVVRSGAVPVTDTESLGAVSPGTGYVNRAAYFTQNPDTAAAWTPQEAADAEFGLTVIS